MEWIFAWECFKPNLSSRVKNIYPIICGQRDKSSGAIENLFESPVLQMLPKVIPHATNGMEGLGMTPSK